MFLRNATKGRRRVLIIIVEVIVFVGIYFGLRAWMQRDLVSGEAPDVFMQDLQDETASLSSYRGEPVLVYFWATWCRVCELQRGAVDAVSKDWPMLSIAMDSGSNEQIKNYLVEKNINWRTVADDNAQIASTFGVNGVPTAFILDADGVIRFSEVGYTTRWGLRTRLWLANWLSS